ncbi:MAG: MarR family transcriptional regulator [Myxococcales bacterium]
MAKGTVRGGATRTTGPGAARGAEAGRSTHGELDWPSASLYAEDPARSPGLQLWREFLSWQRSLNSLLAPLGLTQPQFSILVSLGWLVAYPPQEDGAAAEVTQQRVADFTGMDRMLVSQIVRRLESDGLVRRRSSQRDGRARRLTLTKKGERRLARALPIVEEHDLQFFEGSRAPG